MYPRKNQEKFYEHVLLKLEKEAVRYRILKRGKRKRRQILQSISESFFQGSFILLFKYICRLPYYEIKTYLDLYKTRKNIKRQPYQNYFCNHRIAVYTAIFGDYERLLEPKFCPDNVDYYVFTDQNVAANSKWQKREYKKLLPSSNLSNIEKNRFIKMMPHLFFEDYEYSVYIDGRFEVMSDVTALISKTKCFPIAMHRHSRRDCVYQEIDECINKGRDNVDVLERHRTHLLSLGIPRHWGLLEAGVIVRNHHNPICKDVMTNWWACFLEGCRRDQIALIECLWKKNLDPKLLGGLGKDMSKSHYFVYVPHYNNKNLK